MRRVTTTRDEGAAMGRTQEPDGDYGYDEAHQDVRPAAARPDDIGRGGSAAPAQEDTSGDYGYDEAHDF
jgi:hypothetical protein